jgi:hypothetical protein
LSWTVTTTSRSVSSSAMSTSLALACLATLARASCTTRNSAIAPARLNRGSSSGNLLGAPQVCAPAGLLALPAEGGQQPHRVEQRRTQLLHDAPLELDALVERLLQALETLS